MDANALKFSSPARAGLECHRVSIIEACRDLLQPRMLWPPFVLLVGSRYLRHTDQWFLQATKTLSRAVPNTLWHATRALSRSMNAGGMSRRWTVARRCQGRPFLSGDTDVPGSRNQGLHWDRGLPCGRVRDLVNHGDKNSRQSTRRESCAIQPRPSSVKMHHGIRLSQKRHARGRTE